jgi:hypothetical protein
MLLVAGLAAACKSTYSEASWVVPPPRDPPPAQPATNPSASPAGSASPAAVPPDPLASLPPPSPAPAVKPDAKEADDYAVYRALLEAWHSRETPRAMVIWHETTSFPVEKVLSKESRDKLGVADEVFVDYTSKGEVKIELVNAFGVSVNVFVVGDAELDPIFNEPMDARTRELLQKQLPDVPIREERRRDGWPRFHARYPGTIGIISLSRVAYNKGRSVAMVYASHSRGDLASAGVLFIFKRGPDGWTRDRSTRLWVS